jgi:hypothetical protein
VNAKTGGGIVTNGAHEFEKFLNLNIGAYRRSHPQLKEESVYGVLCKVALQSYARKHPESEFAKFPADPEPVPSEPAAFAGFPLPRVTTVPDVEYNDRGPLVRSELARQLIDAILASGQELSEWETAYLQERREASYKYPTVAFTPAMGYKFEIWCHRAGITCPFHIGPKNSPNA